MSKWITNYLKDRISIVTIEELVKAPKPFIVISEGTAIENRILNQSIHGIDGISAYSLGEGEKGKISLYLKTGVLQY